MLFMLDTDTCSYIIKKRPNSVLDKMEAILEKDNSICISAITYAELLLGAERSNNKTKHNKLINEFTQRLDAIVPWDDSAAEYFAKLQARLYKKGSPIGNNDTMIAGHALSVNAIVVSNNEKHFRKVPKLKLENWVV